MSSCSETTGNISTEVQRTFVSKTFLKDERRHLENMKNQLKNIKIDGFDKACKFYADMQEILDYIEQYAGPKIISTMQVKISVVNNTCYT